jgi:hypothetical protein
MKRRTSILIRDDGGGDYTIRLSVSDADGGSVLDGRKAFDRMIAVLQHYMDNKGIKLDAGLQHEQEGGQGNEVAG